MHPHMYPPALTLQEFAAKDLDYIIIGGGTAGLTVASRLSEIPEFEVGVIEAGEAVFDDPAITRPGLFALAIGSQYDWKFETVPQAGLGGRSLVVPRGKLLGGSSAMNFMAWTRGNREDYDAWADLGNPGWGWDDLLPFFKKTETFIPPSRLHQRLNRSYYQEEFHGKEGPIKYLHMREYGPIQEYWHATMNEVGIETSPDNLSGKNVGAWNLMNAIEPQMQSRCYAANAYYLSVAHRPNLYLVTEAMVREILLEKDGEDWVAKGVRVGCKDEEVTVYAKKEIILCAGAVQSPQLLEVSGVGDPNYLDPAGIPVKLRNSNVGENLRDHMSKLTDLNIPMLIRDAVTQTIFEFCPSLPSSDDFKFDPAKRQAANLAYETSRTGPHTILPTSIAYCPLDKVLGPELVAEFAQRARQIAKDTGTPREEMLARQFDEDRLLGQIEYIFDLSNWSPTFKGEPGKKYATMLQILLYPFSHGWIHIPPMKDGKPSTVDDKPMIDPRFYLGHGQIDFDIMTKAHQFVDRIVAAEPMREIIYKRVFPPASGQAGKDDFENIVRDHSLTDWHRKWDPTVLVGANQSAIGTCAMGGNSGMDAGVVDARLRVYGVKQLRIADGSIFPLPISAHIMATIYAIGEKAASMIIEDSGVQPL